MSGADCMEILAIVCVCMAVSGGIAALSVMAIADLGPTPADDPAVDGWEDY
jgi:hypothetical protein